MSDSSQPKPSRRSARASAKRSFHTLDLEDPSTGEEEPELEDDLDLEGQYLTETRNRKRTRRLVRATTASSRQQQRRTAGSNDLEAEARAMEVAVAKLAPEVEAWKSKYEAIVAENENLKQKLAELTAKVTERHCGATSVEIMEPPAQLNPRPESSGRQNNEPEVGNEPYAIG